MNASKVLRLLQLVRLQRLTLLQELYLPSLAKHQLKPLLPTKYCRVWAMPCSALPARAVVNAKAWRT